MVILRAYLIFLENVKSFFLPCTLSDVSTAYPNLLTTQLAKYKIVKYFFCNFLL